MAYEDIIYEPGAVARIILNRPRYHNAQSTRMIEELDRAFSEAAADRAVRAIILSGAGEHFSAGHDLGTPEELALRAERGLPNDKLGRYVRQRELYVEASLRWRNVPKPTIAMAHGYCIYGGWIFAASMDLVFAAEDALFLPSNLQYFSAPWDIGPKKAKEILYEGRFLTAAEARDLGFVNRIYPPADLERETLAYAGRVAENNPFTTRMTKFMVNNVADTMGYTSSVEANCQTYAFGSITDPRPDAPPRAERRLGGVARAFDLLRRGFPGRQAGV